jgi:hypothetical protein
MANKVLQKQMSNPKSMHRKEKIRAKIKEELKEQYQGLIKQSWFFEKIRLAKP